MISKNKVFTNTVQLFNNIRNLRIIKYGPSMLKNLKKQNLNKFK